MLRKKQTRRKNGTLGMWHDIPPEFVWPGPWSNQDWSNLFIILIYRTWYRRLRLHFLPVVLRGIILETQLNYACKQCVMDIYGMHILQLRFQIVRTQAGFSLFLWERPTSCWTDEGFDSDTLRTIGSRHAIFRMGTYHKYFYKLRITKHWR
jgi:hypothetical protein